MATVLWKRGLNMQSFVLPISLFSGGRLSFGGKMQKCYWFKV